MNDASTNTPRPRRVLVALLFILGIALVGAVVATAVLGMIYFSGAGPFGGGSGGRTFTQKDTVKPQGHATGEVVYSLPFAVPPHLKLTSSHRPYTIVKQTETGFSWSADDIEDDFAGDQNAIKTALRDHNVLNAVFQNQITRKPEIVYEDFTWEATGVPVGAAGDLGLPFEQTGTFQSVLGKEGQEYFAIPYAAPPQITLSGHNGTTIVSEATTGGFKWKNEGMDNPFPGNNAGEVTWTAKGLRGETGEVTSREAVAAVLDPQYAELAELAGGFIHEIKNHISTLGLNLQLLAEDFADPQTQRERRALDRVKRLQSECQRLVDVSNDFLRFARIQDLEAKPADLGAVVEEVVDFFNPTARAANIEIKSYLPSDLPAVTLDADLFKQALLNLLLNAQQAMPDGGAITLQAAADGDGVSLSVIDAGKGMTPEVASKVFRPFFSTRQGGTGLGLATTRKIVEAHGGTIEVQSEVGRGSKFALRLPAVKSA